MIKPIAPPLDSRELISFRHNMAINEHRIFLHLLNAAFYFNQGTGGNNCRQQNLEIYILDALCKNLDKSRIKASLNCKQLLARKDDIFILWSENTSKLGTGHYDYKLNLFEKFDYARGIITMRFNPQLFLLLESINAKFVKSHYSPDLLSLYQSKCKYILKLQDLLVLGKSKRRPLVCSLALLRDVLLVDNPSAYPTNSEFIKHCIMPSAQYLKDHVDFGFDIKFYQDKNKVHLVKFSPQRFPVRHPYNWQAI